MYSREKLIEFHVEARQIKEHHWYEHHEPDMLPMLVVRWRDMQPQSIDVGTVGGMIERLKDWAESTHRETWLTETEMSAPLVIFACLGAANDGVHLPGVAQMPEKGTPIESIWLAVEGYALEADIDEYAAISRKRGDLERDYKTNPASRVTERLTTYQVETSSTGCAEWARLTSSFHKDDGGKIVWGEPLVNTSEDTVIGPGPDTDGDDRLLHIMIPYVTREKLA